MFSVIPPEELSWATFTVGVNHSYRWAESQTSELGVGKWSDLPLLNSLWCDRKCVACICAPSSALNSQMCLHKEVAHAALTAEM